MMIPQDTTQQGLSTAYDSVWADSAAAAAQSSGSLESIMLAQDKLYVVLAVVLIIWLGIVLFLYRTDHKLNRLERSLESSIPEDE